MYNDDILYKHQFSEEELTEMIKDLSVRQSTVLYTQKGLSVDFCCDYIMNEKYSMTDHDEYLDVYDVLRHQTHLTKDDFGL